MSSQRKVIHCVVDATALTHNISEIKKWTANEAITLIVPVYTLEQLHSLKNGPSQTGINAREAVRFLDRVTSGRDSISMNKIILQGPMEEYENWTEVEQFLLPEYEDDMKEAESKKEDIESSAFAFSQKLLDKLNFKKDVEGESAASVDSPNSVHLSAVSSATQSSKTSPEVSAAKLSDVNVSGSSRVNGTSSGSSATPKNSRSRTSVPPGLKPLLNAILWRLHHPVDKSDTMANCILVSNDADTQAWAQKFGITVKNVPKLRQAIIYEDKEHKNRIKYLEKAQPENPLTPEPGPMFKYDDSDEEVVVFGGRNNRGGRGSVRGTRGRRPSTPARAAAPKVDVPKQPIDPDSFSRTPGVTKYAKDDAVNPPSPRGNFHSRPVRGAFRGAPRARGRLWVP